MSRVVVSTHLTLDGVMQAPGQPDEDQRGGFEHGGWQRPYADQVMGAIIGQGMATAGAMLLGRRTYESFAAYWPKQPADNPISMAMNGFKKYVASSTLKEPLEWSNSTLLAGDVPQAVADLKRELERDLVVVGSGELAKTLMQHHLVDEYLLFVHPLVLGSGRRLFAEGVPTSALKLVDTRTSTTGVVILTYQPSDA